MVPPFPSRLPNPDISKRLQRSAFAWIIIVILFQLKDRRVLVAPQKEKPHAITFLGEHAAARPKQPPWCCQLECKALHWQCGRAAAAAEPGCAADKGLPDMHANYDGASLCQNCHKKGEGGRSKGQAVRETRCAPPRCTFTHLCGLGQPSTCHYARQAGCACLSRLQCK